MKAVLLAGGRGTRMGALSENRPKPLINVGGRLLIERPLQRLADLGCTEVILATGHLADQFEDALGDGSRWGVSLVHSVEPQPLGTAGALGLAARGRIDPSETVVVMNADLISDHDLAAQLAAHRGRHADVTLHVRHVDDPRAFGLVRFDVDDRVTSFEEKPQHITPDAWVNAGTYVIRGEILLGIPDDRPVSWEREVLPELLDQGARVYAHRAQSYFRDVGTPHDVAAAEDENR